MMDQNSVYLAGWTEKAGMNETKFGPRGWILLNIEGFKIGGAELQDHKTFVGMSLGADNKKTQERNVGLFKTIQAGGYITFWDVTLNSYVKHGETTVNRELQASPHKFVIGKEAGAPVNLAVVSGKVIQQPAAEWAEMQPTHRPGPKAEPGDPWPTRSVKIHTPQGYQFKVGHYYFVAGKVSGKSPAGKDDLIVVASVINSGT